MADIRTKPTTREYEDGWERVFGSPTPEAEERARAPHDCERCGRHFEYADQRCACTMRSPYVR